MLWYCPFGVAVVTVVITDVAIPIIIDITIR